VFPKAFEKQRSSALQDENVKRKESLKRKAVPEKGGKDGAPSKRPKKEWWDKDARSNQGYEDDDDVEHYRREVPPPLIALSRHPLLC